MNWVETRGRKVAADTEEIRHLYEDLLLECIPFLPEVDPHGIDRRAVEEALRDGDRR